MTYLTRTLCGASALALVAGAAVAQTQATASTDLNIRSGPGPNYEVVGVIDGGAEATVEGCTASGAWCKVEQDGVTGWSYSEYLTATVGANIVTFAEPVPDLEIARIEYNDTTTESAVSGATVGAAVGAVAGGPVGAIVGGAIAGGAVGAAIDPGPEVTSYVVKNPVDQVILNGEAVSGAIIPQSVETYDIPDSDLEYAYVNDQAVILEPGENRIVTVVR